MQQILTKLKPDQKLAASHLKCSICPIRKCDLCSLFAFMLEPKVPKPAYPPSLS